MVEDFDERMAASQRAYADIILNTTKESAARVLVAQRRALHLEKSLSMAKEESLAMLLKIKAIMDSKIIEAEKVNLSRARKIQGLEAQLSEAKDTIECLRSELERLNSKLECSNNSQAEFDNQEAHDGFSIKKNIFHAKKNNSTLATCSYGGSALAPSSNVRNKAGSCLVVKGARRSVSLKDLTTSEDCAGKPDFSSIILRNKETELYRNGCTQRIRAIEQNLPTKREPAAQIHDQELKIERGANVSEDGKSERPNFEDSKENGWPSEDCGNSQIIRLACRRLCKRRRSRQRRSVTMPLFFGTSNGLAEQEDVSANQISKNAGVPGSGEQNLSGDIPHIPRGDTTQTTHVPQFHKEDSEICKDGKLDLTCKETSGHSNIDKIMTRRVAMEQCDTYIDKQVRSPISCAGGEHAEGNGKELIPVNTINMSADEEVNKDMVVASVEEGVKLATANLTIEDNLDNAVIKELEPDLENLVSKNREHCTPRDVPAEGGSDRVVKYIRRKRKRECIDKRDSVSSEEKSSKKKVEKEKASVEPQKHSSVMESSRDSRRLAQVARQLISLSEKRWW